MDRPSIPVALLAVLVGACGDPSTPSPAAAPPSSSQARPPGAPENQVTILTPQYQVRPGTLETTGKVQFNEEALVRVHTPVTGRVLEVLTHPGEAVDTGHALLVLDSPDLGAAKSDYAKAVADVERSDKALALARELYEVRAIPQKDIREAENDNRKAVAERDRAAARLRTLGVPEAQFGDVAARADASTRLLVRAPRSGVIVERNVGPGQVVAYGQSDNPVNLFVIADLTTMWVLADIYEPDVPRVRVGQPVLVSLPCCPGERVEGRVTYISDAVDKESRTVKVRAVVPNRNRVLKAEMFARVAIQTGSVRALTVPQSAVHREGGETFVLVEKGPGEYERRPVKLGPDLDGTVEVQEGVSAQDRVVATGSILLKRTVK